MTIGYMTLEINEKGEPRIKKDVQGKEMLTLLDIDFEYSTEIHSEGLEMIRASIPKDLKDVLILVTFKYENSGGGYFMDDYEDWLTIETQVMLKESYKEFYRHQLTLELDINGKLKNLSDDLPALCPEEDMPGLNERIGEWEEFYDEDFVPTVMKKEQEHPFSLK